MLNAARTFAKGAIRYGRTGRGACGFTLSVRAGSALAASISSGNGGGWPHDVTVHLGNLPPRYGAPFSSSPSAKDVQKQMWNDYLAGKTPASDLFREIDLNLTDTISVEEVNFFLDSVGRKGVSDRAFETLQKMGLDHELEEEEFAGWLAMATSRSEEGAKNVQVETAKESEPEAPVAAKSEAEQPKKKKVVDARKGIQKMVWEHYLSTGTHGDDLFLMIDLNKNRSISVSEIVYFLDSVGRSGVRDDEFDKLMALGNDHELNKEEFLEWLSVAAEVQQSSS